MNLTCYIVDDEYHAIERISGYIGKTPGLQLAGSATNPLRALEEISFEQPPMIIFLDIDMPELSGLELAGLVNSFTTVVFTTAYREYALEAFEKQAMDYLLKPISYERFLKTIEKIRKSITLPSKILQQKSTFLFVKGGIGNKFSRIDFTDLDHIAAADNYVELYVKEQVIVTYMTMRDILAQLPASAFSRIHKSYIINHDHVNKFDYNYVTLSSDKVLPIGRVYRKSFFQKMKSSALDQ